MLLDKTRWSNWLLSNIGREVAHEEETEAEAEEERGEVGENRKVKDFEPYTPRKDYSRRPKREEI